MRTLIKHWKFPTKILKILVSYLAAYPPIGPCPLVPIGPYPYTYT